MAILFVVTAPYIIISRTYFCSYDDYLELRRAAFEDAQEPSRIFTTPHLGSYKYRPLNRALVFLSFWAGGGRAEVFRLRNLFSHLANVLLLYALGIHLLGRPRVAAWAACLFGLHPLASVNVVGAVCTNTTAHAAALLALILFLTSVGTAPPSRAKMAMAMLLAGVSLFTYDADIVVLGMMAAYLVLHIWKSSKPPVNTRHILEFVVLGACLIGIYLLARALFVPRGWAKAAKSVPSVGTIAKNVVLYGISIVSPIDPVLANEWFNAPLPSEIQIHASDVALGAVVGCVGLALFAWLVYRRIRSTHSPSDVFDSLPVIFLIVCLLGPLVPFLLIEPHASETYLYLSVAFYLLLIVHVLYWLLDEPSSLPRRVILQCILMGLFLSLASGTWVRNQRVSACGTTAHRILTGIPQGDMKEGAWTLRFANLPGEPRSRPYGCYGFQGTDTIGDRSHADEGLTAALQFVYRNQRLTATVLDPGMMSHVCEPPSAADQICIGVHADGRTEEWHPTAASRPRSP